MRNLLCLVLLQQIWLTFVGSNTLDVTNVRLADGNGPFEGRVEIQIDGVWGTVCDWDFSATDAAVMCRTMGLLRTAQFNRAYYGQGIGPIFAQYFSCNGRESHIRDCPYAPNTYCSHSRDIGLICTECGEISVQNGAVQSVSSDGTVLTISCNADYEIATNTTTCLNGTWTKPVLACTPIGYNLNISDIRLVNGIGISDGRVELLVNNTWVAVCRDGFDSNDAMVFCRMLGFPDVYMLNSGSYGSGSGPFYLSNMGCNGSESHIDNCTYEVTHTCSYRDVAVICKYTYNTTDIQLVGGSGPDNGRLEIMVNGTWGTVCSKYWYSHYVGVDVVETYCRMLGLNLTMYNRTAIYGRGSGLIFKGRSTCYGPKESINDCTTYPPSPQFCSHYYDVSLACTSCGVPVISRGYLFSVNGTEFTAICYDGYNPKELKLYCQSNGTWIHEDVCTYKYAYPLDIDEIRLANSQRPRSEGRVELLVDGSWGTVCDNNFNSASAAVICRMFGLVLGTYYTRANRFGRGSGRIYVENLKCNGTENHINNCTYNVENTCTHNEDVSVICTGYHLNITDIRLAGTSGPYHGRVELEVNGTWGTVADDYFHSAEAQVVCRMLGLKQYRYHNGAHYGQGSGPIYIDRLDCSGTETHINQCNYSIDNYYNKQHNEDVSVICWGPPLNITDGRLANGTGPYDGRVEIKVGDTWGTICDENFGYADSDAFCRLLGLRAARFFTGGLYGEGSGPIFIDQLFCEGNDVNNDYDDIHDLSSCQYFFLNECSHEQDVSVVCNECGQPDIYYWDVGYFSYNGTTLYADCSYYKSYVGKLKLTCDNITKTWMKEGECEEYRFPLNITDIRLVDGPGETNGRVEIQSLGVWGTICDDGFNKGAADALCNMIGYPPAHSYFPRAHYGEGKGPIFVDDLICAENATHINNCTYKTYDNCYHSDDISVNCTDCGIPKPHNGSINSSATNYGAVIEVTCNKDFKLIGEQIISCLISGTWSDRPKCELLDCGDPTPEHGSSNASVTILGAVVHVFCDEGYNISGDAILRCQSDETWTDSPTCEIIDCGELNVPFAEVTLPDNETTFGETARIECLPGYILSGNPTVSCLSDGNWETFPTCEIVDCGDPVPYNASANSTETTFGSVVEITCGRGQNITGNSTIICQEDGTWTDNPVCNVKDCGVLSIPNGNVNDSLGTLVDSVASINCNKGFELIGSPLASCLMSDKGVAWNYSAICAIQVCEDPTPVNGRISGEDGKFEYEHYVEIDCNKGYNLVGDNIIVCEDGGLWSDNPHCEIVVCEDLTGPENGYVDTSQGSTYGAKNMFSCKEDYLLVGEDTSVCEKAGEWSNKPPTCVAKSPVGGHCINEIYCLMEDSRCVNSVCTCITGIFDTRTKKCDTMPLMPFGPSTGDVSVKVNRKCGPKISFGPGFPLFGKMHMDLFVCVFGFMSIDDVYANPTPPKTRKDVHTFRDKRTIIAPFYAQIDRRRSGPVWYRTYDILNSPEKMRDEAETISFIENIVVKFEKLESFEASFILVATWHDRKTETPGFDRTKTSTFQAVLITDGKSTYIFYIYGNGMMQWVNHLSENPLIWIGFSIDSLVNTNAYSFSSASLHLDAKQSVSVSENDVAGLIYHSLNKPGQKVENPGVDCIRWYNNNFKDKKRLDYIASLMPECPCDIRLARFDPFFWQIGFQRWRRNTKYACVDMLHVGNFNEYGKSCCYDLETWLWVYERPFAGGFQRFNARHNSEKHIRNDAIPKALCCHNSYHCNLFYELRPIGSCYRKSPYNFGSFWGDPHFSTLDGMNFTFNGLGEYTLLKINSDNCTFDLQARTERAVKENGELSDATVFSAFAAKEYLGSTVHVERNMKRDGMNLYGNKVDLTKQLYSKYDDADPFVWTSTDNKLSISKRNESVNVFFPSCGISLMISIKVEMLSLTTFVPRALKNKTKGLLGNYDDDPYNDFTFPNGTIVNANISEREIFQYGKTWSISSNDSAFVYNVGKSHADYHNDSYQPKFLDDVDEVLLTKAVKLCNGIQNRECIFDYAFTEKEEIANETQNFKLNKVADKVEIDEVIPTLVGCSPVIAIKGKSVSCKYNSSDNVYFVSNTTDAKIDTVASAITYVQTTDEPVDIRISSRNEDGRSSPTFVLSVILCTNCSGHGVCTNVTRNDPRENEYFRYTACECDPQYEGYDCENEFDGCAADPCSWNRTCEKLSAEEQKNQNKSYKCGPCPEGFTTDNEDECIDVDECVDGNGGCEQTCTNLDGSFKCSCGNGYRTDVFDITQCRDINECDEAIHNCDQLCNNTDGSFECECYNGYEYNTTSMSCALTSGDACTDDGKSQCPIGAHCIVENGQPFCFCMNGYELSENGSLCIDINECSRGVCTQGCVNTIGSFQCSCFKGYRLEGVATCAECDVLHWGDNCEQTCACNGRGADRCDSAKGCICFAGWNGTSCNDDINECNTFDQACGDARKKCVNNLGSYSCECISGFYETEEGICKDVDECSDVQLNTCEQLCENTVAGFTCACRNGYTKLSNTTCKDIDECELETDSCEQRCDNSDGSYSCFCHYGYILNDDRRTCSKILDPCWTLRNLNCSHFCQMEDEIAECKCQHGYVLESDNETCTDVNECTDSHKHRCDEDATCRNTAGSYQCKCPTGKRLENDGRTCSECDDFHFGENCAHKCSCLNGKCDKKTGCICYPGWAGSQCDIDMDECATGQVLCTGDNSVCVNVLGSAFCSCESGYTNVSGVCQDIDECAADVCDQTCTNTDGSFFCTCRNGFILEEKCTDIDECSGSHGCNQICQNTVGSYRCLCEDGFRLNLNDRQTCIAENECSETEHGNCTDNSHCYVSEGRADCKCFKGYQNINGGCEDIDECLSNPCSQICSNTEGSFECSCYKGYSLMNDGFTCQECSSWVYGHNCSIECLCNRHNSKNCNHENGTCTCKSGWTGIQCDEDVNECKNESVCPNNSTCKNKNGYFTCMCDKGFFKTGDGNCNECDERHFGQNCLNECACNFENTDDCQHDTGECICHQGWTGTICTEDFNECDSVPDICESKPNSTCNNNIGSYFCECYDGYQEINGRCEDRNECMDKTINKCQQTCVNKPGSFICQCEHGFRIQNDSVSCSDIDECDERLDQCNQTCSNNIGSYNCACESGFMLAMDGFSCDVCENGHFGTNCSDVCECIEENTQFCHHLNGNCSCNEGWIGTTCSSDINECEFTHDVCASKVNSTCENTIGSYLCTCDQGFREQGSICTDCERWMYGDACNLECDCAKAKSKYCHPKTGQCICELGWNGTKCEDDIDECRDDSSCPEHSTCMNTNGSYNCTCNTGYMDSESGRCKECTNNTFGENCTGECNCVAANSGKVEQTCNTLTGECVCKPNWDGQTCSEDVDECAIDLTLCKNEDNKVCVNTNGSYECDCIRGYTISVNGGCVEDKGQTVQNQDGEAVINVIVIINVDLPLGTNLNASSTYTNLKDKCVTSMQEFLKRFTRKSMQIIVHDIWIGSIAVNYSIVDSQNDETAELENDDTVDWYKAVAELHNSYFIFDGKNVSVSSESYKNLAPCEFYQELNGICPDGFTCEAENTVASCKQITEKSRDNWPVIIGASAGGLFILIVSAILVVLVKMMKNRREKTQHTRQGHVQSHSDWKTGEAAGLERTMPTWRPGYTRSSLSDTYGQSHAYHIPRAKLTRSIEDSERYSY